MWLKFSSLYKKEIFRFMKVYHQTLLTPVVNALLFLAIFTLAFNRDINIAENISYKEFIAPGIISMVMIMNAFANSSSSMTMSKVLGFVTDFLIPPIGSFNLVLAMSLAAATRGIMVGIVSFLAISLFVDINISHPIILILYLLLINLNLGLIGLICGFYSNSFDQMSSFSSYVITPLSFLSGTFYSVSVLPEFWYKISSLNPFFYMIDGIRYAFTSYSDGNITLGLSYLSIMAIILFVVAVIWFQKGYKIRG